MEVGNGAFVTSLKRNNKQIRDDRAQAIAEDAYTIFRRAVEDIGLRINRMKRDRENKLDLAPANATSLKPAQDFDVDDFIKNEITYATNIRNDLILYRLMNDRFFYLFGERLQDLDAGPGSTKSTEEEK